MLATCLLRGPPVLVRLCAALVVFPCYPLQKKRKKTFIQYSVESEECRVTRILTPLVWEGETVVQCSSIIQDPTSSMGPIVQ